MNKNKTLLLLQKRYGNVVEIDTDLVRTEHRHNDQTLAVFYFDFSQTVVGPEFDARAYTQKHIASDFYKHEGSLQWNYYLNFVLENDAFQKIHTTSKAKEIEADRIFARKFIREKDSLDAELSRPLAETLHSTQPSQDIASRWVKELNEAGLGQIAEPTAEYVRVVRDYLSGKSDRDITTPTATTSVPNGHFIRSLHLDNFRTLPKQREYAFGTVNLFRGVNGTGKTSLLEAIELCICGANRRQQGTQPNGAKLRIQYEDQSQFERCPQSKAEGYRARDLTWYGGYYRQGNRLCDNFGRFNFFDSDAAYKLSSAKASGDEIVMAINGLLLGESATIIEERMRQFQMRFERENREMEGLIKIRKQEVKNAAEQLDQLKRIKDTREALLRDLQSKAKDCGWHKLPARLKLDNLAILQEEVEDAGTRISQNIERLSWLPRISIASLKHESEQLTIASKHISEEKDQAKANSVTLEQNKNKIIEVEAVLKLLKRLSEYHAEHEAMSLIGVNAAIIGTKATVNKFKEALGWLQDVNLKEFEQCVGTFEQIAKEKEIELGKVRRNLAKLKSRASELQTQLGTIKSVVEEIKGLGRRFCELNPHITDCPLCGAHYDELSGRIASLEFSAPIQQSLREVTAEIARVQVHHVELQKATDALTQIRRAGQILLSPNQLASLSAKAVIENLKGLDDNLTSENMKLNELTLKEKRLKLIGFQEGELQGLMEVAQDNYSLSRSKILIKTTVQALITEKLKTLDALQRTVHEKEMVKTGIEGRMRRVVNEALGNAVVDNYDVELERRKTVVEAALAEGRVLQKTISISDSDDFSSIEKSMEGFAKSIGRIQLALKRVEEKGALEKHLAANLSEAKNEIDKSQPKLTRTTTALSVLGKLLGSDYKGKYLQNIIGIHREKISTIFSGIHAPHEFKEIVINSDVQLERDNGVKSDLSEISTGQRAALALSIFLGLNSSVSTRAPWLLFDEPVAHVDDLNILSFLDMLREMVIIGNRQVFFATANTRIADLFARKFDFLGTEFFKEYTFSR